MRRLPTVRFLLIAALIVVFGTLAIYWSGTQKKLLFAQVTFGTDQSQSVWFVAKGSSLYIDRDASDGIQPAEFLGQNRVDLPFEFTALDGKTVYRNMSAGLQLASEALSDQRRQKLFFDVDIDGTAQFRQSGVVEMSEQANDAATLQVDSVLQLRVPEKGMLTQLMVGGESADVRVEVITVHLDSRARISLDTKAALDQPSDSNDTEIIVPVVEIHFPAGNSTTVPTERFALDKLC